MCRSESEKSNLNTSLARLEEENMDMQRQIQSLQAQLSELESQHAQRSVVKHLSSPTAIFCDIYQFMRADISNGSQVAMGRE